MPSDSKSKLERVDISIDPANIRSPHLDPEAFKRFRLPLDIKVTPVKPFPQLDLRTKMDGAKEALEAKASALGQDFTGPATEAVKQLDGVGFQRQYANCVVYFSDETGAHEVHGEILRKYQQLNGPAAFGLPRTDETGAPDGSGRYNHFGTASIYWHPNTGPMAVSDPVRTEWAKLGWELSDKGYPIEDVYSPTSGAWVGDFQNGVIWADSNGSSEPLVAALTPDQLLGAVWGFFDQEVHKRPDNIGLHPERSLDLVSETGYDFWYSWNRTISVQINGFHDNGLASDTDFTAFMTLWFEALEGDNQSHNVTVGIGALKVSASGLGSGEVANGVKDGIKSSLPKTLGTIPKEAQLLSFKVGKTGGLTAYLAPTPGGHVAQGLVQAAMDGFGH